MEFSHTILSLGAGVQSSALALMSEKGDAPKVDCAIFADPGAEKLGTYEWLDWLESQLSFPVHRVMEKDGLTKSLEASAATGTRTANAPFYAKIGEFREYQGELIQISEREGMLRRTCTQEFKIKPIERKTREILGVAPGRRVPGGVKVNSMQGISVDEIQRMRESTRQWMTFTYPLVEMRLSRHDCKRWMGQNGYPEPPRSACVYCPYHSNNEWRDLRDNDSAGWQEAVRVDALIRSGHQETEQELYVHQSLKPLPEVDLTTDEDHGQMTFMAECEGHCGV